MDLHTRIEALLFISARPVTSSQLANALGTSSREIDLALTQLASQYEGRGINLQTSKEGVQLVSSPSYAEDIETFLGLEEIARLSRAALEVLAIIAYQQPVTRPQVDAIRGVNSDGVLKNLLHKGLIQEVGRAEGPGRPILYSTTPEFLGHFGLTSLEELPPLNLDELAMKDESGDLLKD